MKKHTTDGQRAERRIQSGAMYNLLDTIIFNEVKLDVLGIKVDGDGGYLYYIDYTALDKEEIWVKESELSPLAEESVQEVSKIEAEPSKKVSKLDSTQGQPYSSYKDNPQKLNKVGSDVKSASDTNVTTKDTAPEEWENTYYIVFGKLIRKYIDAYYKVNMPDSYGGNVPFEAASDFIDRQKGFIRTLLQARDERAETELKKQEEKHAKWLKNYGDTLRTQERERAVEILEETKLKDEKKYHLGREDVITWNQALDKAITAIRTSDHEGEGRGE